MISRGSKQVGIFSEILQYKYESKSSVHLGSKQLGIFSVIYYTHLKKNTAHFVG